MKFYTCKKKNMHKANDKRFIKHIIQASRQNFHIFTHLLVFAPSTDVTIIYIRKQNLKILHGPRSRARL